MSHLTSIVKQLIELREAKLKGQSAVCKSNLKQMYLAQMMYHNENSGRVMGTEYGAEWIAAKQWRDLDGGSWNDFHDGNTGFLEPYSGDGESSVYKCPASSYDTSSRFYNAHKGRSYSGFTSRNWRHPYLLEDMHVVRTGTSNFRDANRKPFFWDYNAPLNDDWWMGTGFQVHGNTGFLNMCITDGSVVRAKLPVGLWSRFANSDWVPYLEAATGEDAN